MVVATTTLSSVTFAGNFLPSKTLPNEKLEECRDLYLQGKKEYQKNNFIDSVRLYLKAVYLQEMLLGKYHQDTIKTYWRLGRAAAMAQQDQQAVEAFYRACRFAETTFDESVVQSLIQDVDAVWKARESSQEEEGRNPAAIKSPRESLEKLLELEKTADVSCKKGGYQDAIQAYQEALGLLNDLAGSDTVCGSDLRVKMSTCYLKHGQTSEASRALTAAHECYVRRLGDDHPATLGAAANLRSLNKKSFQEKGWRASLSSLGSKEDSRDVPTTPTSSP